MFDTIYVKSVSVRLKNCASSIIYTSPPFFISQINMTPMIYQKTPFASAYHHGFCSVLQVLSSILSLVLTFQQSQCNKHLYSRLDISETIQSLLSSLDIAQIYRSLQQVGPIVLVDLLMFF